MAPARTALPTALRRLLPRPVLFVVALLAVAVALLPLAYLAVRTADAGADRISQILFTERVARLALRSLGLAAVVTSAALVLGIGSAFLVTRTDLPARRAFGVLAALPLAIPTYVAGFAWISQLPRFEGFWAAALVLSLACYPYVYLPVAAALAAADPAQEEVAQSLGRSPWQTFTGVTLRQIRPAAAGGGLLVALYVLSDFGAVAMLRTDTLTRAVFVSLDLGFDRIGAIVLSGLLVAMTIPILVGEAATRKRGARYARLTGVRRPAARIPLRHWRTPALLALSAVAAAALGVTALSLTRRLAAGVSRPGAWSEVAAAAGASIWLSLTGVVLTMLLALPIGLLTARAPGPAANLVDRLGYLTHALPGVVVGLSLVFFGINVAYPLYQTTWLLALGYAALFLPLAVAAVNGAAVAAPPALDDVARSLGRGPLTVARTVTLPLMLPGVGAGAALVFLTCMKELPATLLLRPTGVDTLATELWTHTTVAAYSAAAPYAALLVAVSAVPTWLLAVGTGVLAKEGAR